MIEHVGIAHALFGDYVAESKETITGVLEGRLPVVARIYFYGELVGRDLRALV